MRPESRCFLSGNSICVGKAQVLAHLAPCSPGLTVAARGTHGPSPNTRQDVGMQPAQWRSLRAARFRNWGWVSRTRSGGGFGGMRPRRPSVLQPAEPAAFAYIPTVAAVRQKLQRPGSVEVRLDHHLPGGKWTVSIFFSGLKTRGPCTGALQDGPCMDKEFCRLPHSSEC